MHSERHRGDVTEAMSGAGKRRYGFSGSRDVNEAKNHIIENVLSALPHGLAYTTGACMGVDTLIGLNVWLSHPDATHRVIVPANRSRIDPWWMHRAIREGGDVLVQEMPAGTTYKDRNLQIVQHSDVLVAFPYYPEADERSKRSGTWQTIRMARRSDLEVVVTVLSDEVEQ